MIALYYYEKKCGAPLKTFLIISALIQNPQLFFSSYIYTHTCIFLSSFSVPWFLLKQHCWDFIIFSLLIKYPRNIINVSRRAQYKIIYFSKWDYLQQCRLCELLEDSNSHKLLTLLLEAYGLFTPRYIIKGEAFLPVSWNAGISWSYKPL